MMLLIFVATKGQKERVIRSYFRELDTDLELIFKIIKSYVVFEKLADIQCNLKKRNERRYFQVNFINICRVVSAVKPSSRNRLNFCKI